MMPVYADNTITIYFFCSVGHAGCCHTVIAYPSSPVQPIAPSPAYAEVFARRICGFVRRMPCALVQQQAATVSCCRLLEPLPMPPRYSRSAQYVMLAMFHISFQFPTFDTMLMLLPAYARVFMSVSAEE